MNKVLGYSIHVVYNETLTLVSAVIPASVSEVSDAGFRFLTWNSNVFIMQSRRTSSYYQLYLSHKKTSTLAIYNVENKLCSFNLLGL
jgi:hypothetical protein